MSVLRHEVRPGAYRDSIVLMGLRAALAERPGMLDAGAVMASPENLALLEESGLLPPGARDLGPADLLVVVRAEDEASATEALASVDRLLSRPISGIGDAGDVRPRSLASAARRAPGVRWVLVSVPGRYAAAVAREALRLGRHVFLFSDHVSLADEVALKREARERGLLVMGPDCGTALVNGVGFGFANRVRRGPVGIVAASGTGLQAVSCRVHELGSGVSHGIGTGGRDLRAEVGGAATLQALDALRRDPRTRAIALLSKPPSPGVGRIVLEAAAATGKPVALLFQGEETPPPRLPGVRRVRTLGEAAAVAVELAGGAAAPPRRPPAAEERATAGTPVLGLFSGGTLALEAALALRAAGRRVRTNLALPGAEAWPDGATGARGASDHSPTPGPPADGFGSGDLVLDLGADEWTAGRPHPMIDAGARLRLLERAAAETEPRLILIDVVLGFGAHPDPGGQLAPAIRAVRRAGHRLAAVVVGTEEDPQDLAAQRERLAAAGAILFPGAAEAVEGALGPHPAPAAVGAPRERGATEAPPVTDVDRASDRTPGGAGTPLALEDLATPVQAICVGIELFHAALLAQGVPAVQVEWRPPAGGDERLAAILERMKG